MVSGVGRRWIGSDRGEQSVLPVPALADVIPRDHLAWDVLGFVDALDLSQFEAAYRVDGVGRPPFAPRLMLGLIVYSMSKKMRSDREIAQMSADDLGARLITGNRTVSRSAIIGFRTLHARPLRGVLAQSVRIGHGKGLVDVSVVAGDGTKMSANSAMATTVELDVVAQQITILERRLQDALRVWTQVTGQRGYIPPPLPDIDQWQGVDEDGEAVEDLDASGSDSGAPAMSQQQAWRRVCVIRTMLNARREALEHLRAHPPATQNTEWWASLSAARARLARGEVRVAAVLARLQAAYDERQAQIAADRAAYAPAFGYPRMVEPSQHSQVRHAQERLEAARAHLAEIEANPPSLAKVNTTDPVSRIMPGKHGGFVQAYNVQILTSADQFILTIGTHDNPNDKQALVALVNDAQATLDAADITEPIGVALFDNGYASENNFKTPLPTETLLLVAVQKEARQTGRNPEQAKIGPAWQEMADRFEDPANVALYKRRAAIVEPVFAQLFNRFGHNLYHRDDVLTELHLLAITHNFLKIRRHRHRKPAAA